MPTPYTTTQAVKQMLTVDPANQDDNGLIETIVDGVNAAFDAILARSILSADYTDTLNGSGSAVQMLRNRPITAVASVSVGNLPSGRVGLAVGAQVTFTECALQRLDGGAFPRGLSNVVVAYTAGFACVPADLAHKATHAGAYWYRRATRVGQNVKSLASQTITFDTADLPKDVWLVLNQYQRRVPV